MIESVLTLPLLILAFSAILLLGYRGLVFYSVDTQLHEALICLDDETASACRANLEKRIRPLLVFKIPFSVELRRSGSLARGEVRIDFRNLMKRSSPMILRKEMSFPLRVSSK
ncbi:hypothetical protein D3C87_1261540 [compost metagenome]